MATFNQTRHDALRTLEWMELKAANECLGVAFGLFAAYKASNLNVSAAKRHSIFRKPWMRWVYPGFFFFLGWYGGREFRPRILQGGRKHVTFDKVVGDSDIIAQFRAPVDDPRNEKQLDTVNYLLQHGEITRDGMLDAMLARLAEKSDFLEKYRIKRRGRDEDELKWLFSKIHSLENIAFVSDEALSQVHSNPVRLQREIYDAEIPTSPASSYE
jgi:hypothetical protein